MSELLGGDVGGVIGFDAVSPVHDPMGLGPELAMDMLQEHSSQFQIVLKQLGKRDTTTKLKVRPSVIT
jgi:hypothetical protein